MVEMNAVFRLLLQTPAIFARRLALSCFVLCLCIRSAHAFPHKSGMGIFDSRLFYRMQKPAPKSGLLHAMVEMMGIEPMSESISTRFSPSAAFVLMLRAR